ncbi:MAG TPA: hypothetical protein VK013_06420 [Myxococcaceae bacterium]|nr:hypothetical protein [Myxococcaceae bacterium]
MPRTSRRTLVTRTGWRLVVLPAGAYLPPAARAVFQLRGAR